MQKLRKCKILEYLKQLLKANVYLQNQGWFLYNAGPGYSFPKPKWRLEGILKHKAETVWKTKQNKTKPRNLRFSSFGNLTSLGLMMPLKVPFLEGKQNALTLSASLLSKRNFPRFPHEGFKFRYGVRQHYQAYLRQTFISVTHSICAFSF